MGGRGRAPDQRPTHCPRWSLPSWLLSVLGVRQKPGRSGLWLSPPAPRSPEDNIGLGMWPGQAMASPILEWFLLTSLPGVHYAGMGTSPFTLGGTRPASWGPGVSFPKSPPPLKALGLEKAASMCPRAAEHVETWGEGSPPARAPGRLPGGGGLPARPYGRAV